jgi:insulysin
MLTANPAEADAAEIEKLTKKDIVDFFNTFMSPKSPSRAKLSVHLLAQGQAQAANMSSSEKLAKLQEKLTELLEEQEIPVDKDKLHARIKTIDPSTGNADTVLQVMVAYLVKDLGIDEEEVEELMEQGQAMLGGVLASAGMQTELEMGDKPAVNGSATSNAIVIKDVRAYKAQLQTTSGPQPYKHITEFEDLEPKL